MPPHDKKHGIANTSDHDGTGIATNNILVSDANGLPSALGSGTSGQVLKSNGAGVNPGFVDIGSLLPVTINGLWLGDLVPEYTPVNINPVVNTVYGIPMSVRANCTVTHIRVMINATSLTHRMNAKIYRLSDGVGQAATVTNYNPGNVIGVHTMPLDASWAATPGIYLLCIQSNEIRAVKGRTSDFTDTKTSMSEAQGSFTMPANLTTPYTYIVNKMALLALYTGGAP